MQLLLKACISDRVIKCSFAGTLVVGMSAGSLVESNLKRTFSDSLHGPFQGNCALPPPEKVAWLIKPRWRTDTVPSFKSHDEFRNFTSQ